ncbi:MAG: translation elongation factor Ts [Mycobacteriales bacterium]|nr:translation elongation factor Ts [Frankia sp.]
MAEISASDVKKLREMTGAGMMDCKKALQDTDGDFDKAIETLRLKGAKDVGKRESRTASNGLVTSYLHRTSPDLPPTVGVLLELNCETDFVAKTDQFQSLAKDLAQHIAAANPLYVHADEVPAEVIEAERKIFEQIARDEGKPEAAIERIVDGRVSGYYKDFCLYEQSWVRETKKTIRQLLDEANASLGEKIEVRRFARYKVGQP